VISADSVPRGHKHADSPGPHPFCASQHQCQITAHVLKLADRVSYEVQRPPNTGITHGRIQSLSILWPARVAYRSAVKHPVVACNGALAHVPRSRNGFSHIAIRTDFPASVVPPGQKRHAATCRVTQYTNGSNVASTHRQRPRQHTSSLLPSWRTPREDLVVFANRAGNALDAAAGAETCHFHAPSPIQSYFTSELGISNVQGTNVLTSPLRTFVAHPFTVPAAVFAIAFHSLERDHRQGDRQMHAGRPGSIISGGTFISSRSPDAFQTRATITTSRPLRRDNGDVRARGIPIRHQQ